jgi:ElaB/YqjD/DUF883 family membrane-anchored ribosome-binding protein
MGQRKTSTIMTQEYTSDKSNAAIEADIAQTRDRMDTTLDRLLDRLQPRHILNDLLDFWQSRRSGKGDGHHIAEAVRENTRKAGQTMAQQVRDNPVPSLLIGAGIAWLIFDRSRPDRDRAWLEPAEDMDMDDDYYGAMDDDDATSGSAGEGVTGAVAGAKEKAGEVAGEAKRRLRETGRHLRDKARYRGERIRARTSDMRHEMQDRLRSSYERAQQRLKQGCQRTQAQLQQTADKHPLATGAACLGAGLLAGFLVPHTRREDEMMGDLSDSFKDRAKEAGQDLVERGKHIAGAATEAARSEAEHQGLTPDHLKAGVKAVGREAMHTAQQTAEKEGLAPHSKKETSDDKIGGAEKTRDEPSWKQTS